MKLSIRTIAVYLQGALFLGLITANSSQAGSTQILLRSVVDNKYVRGGLGTYSFLDAASYSVSRWEVFNLIELEDGKVALQSSESGKYVRAGVGSGSYLAAISDYVQDWERFHLISLGDGNVALQSDVSGKYVRAGTPYLTAVSETIQGWETFEMIGAGLTCRDGMVYDCAGQCVSRSTVGAWLGDGLCDDGTWGIELWCVHYDYDGRDCLEKPGDHCGTGQTNDCALGCVSETTAQSWVGDGYCDDGQYGINLLCEYFGFDEGDCND